MKIMFIAYFFLFYIPLRCLCVLQIEDHYPRPYQTLYPTAVSAICVVRWRIWYSGYDIMSTKYTCCPSLSPLLFGWFLSLFPSPLVWISLLFSGLKKRQSRYSRFGLYNGHEFVFTESDWEMLTYANLAWRYGYSIIKLQRYIGEMLKKFER